MILTTKIINDTKFAVVFNIYHKKNIIKKHLVYWHSNIVQNTWEF